MGLRSDCLRSNDWKLMRPEVWCSSRVYPAVIDQLCSRWLIDWTCWLWRSICPWLGQANWKHETEWPSHIWCSCRANADSEIGALIFHLHKRVLLIHREESVFNDFLKIFNDCKMRWICVGYRTEIKYFLNIIIYTIRKDSCMYSARITQSPTLFPDWYVLSADSPVRFSPSYTLWSHWGD